MTNRLMSLTHDITLGATEERPKGHQVTLAIMYDKHETPVEMMFVGRG